MVAAAAFCGAKRLAGVAEKNLTRFTLRLRSQSIIGVGRVQSDAACIKSWEAYISG